MELSWGKCTIKIGKLQSSGEAPSSWIDIELYKIDTYKRCEERGQD